MKTIFEEMYQKKIWGGGSGVGSLPEATVRYRAVLQKLLADYHVRSVVDIGCGDWQTGSRVDWTGIEYTGIDIVAEVIEADRKRYGRRGRASSVEMCWRCRRWQRTCSSSKMFSSIGCRRTYSVSCR